MAALTVAIGEAGDYASALRKAARFYEDHANATPALSEAHKMEVLAECDKVNELARMLERGVQEYLGRRVAGVVLD